MNIAFAFFPIVFTMICGYGLAQFGTLTKDGWTAVETLSFRFLIPVVLIKSISSSNLALSEFIGVISVTVLTLCLAAVAVFVFRALRGPDKLPNPDFTTLVQTTTRWNAFIALAAAELLTGQAALTLIAAAMAILIPLINVSNIIVLARFGTAKPTMTSIVFQIAKNPLVQGCLLGLAINLSGLHLPDMIVQTLDLIGRATLGIGLLTVGAALSVKRLLHASSTVVAGVMFRLVLCPVIFILASRLFGLSPLEMRSGVLLLAVPAASNGYIVAKQMGGNAELCADVLSWQTILSMVALPSYVLIIANL